MTAEKKKSPEELRSHRWLGREDLRSFGHRSRLQQMGYDRVDWVGKPVIGILNTWSDINACHGHLRARAEDVKRGIWEAGGFPVELPAISLAEPFVKPSTMLYRNLLAMECEELLRSHPIDGAVLMGGCDKTTPGLVMGAISMGVPAIYVPAGPMLRGNWRGHTLGSGSNVWKYWDEKRAGHIGDAEWNEIEGGIARSFGTCMVMGTAATMMAITEALGLALPGASSIPAVDANHPRMCAAAGRRIVAMVWEDLTPAKILSPAAFDNAIRVHMALGGSTNAIIHVIAMARRAGVALDMGRFDEISREMPVIANITPSGKYLMEDFFYAGGLRALMAVMKDAARPLLPHGHRRHHRRQYRRRRRLPSRCHPFARRAALSGGRDRRADRQSGAARLRDEARRRRQALPAASRQGDRVRELRSHGARGRARRPRRDAGPYSGAEERRPQGRPRHAGMGHAADPEEAHQSRRARHGAHFRRAHERHQLRRLHPACGAGELHRRPARLRCRPATRSRSTLPRGSIHLHVGDEELSRRQAAWKAPPPHYARGYGAMYSQHIGQADEGCDFDFLEGQAPIAEPEIH